MKNLQSAQNFQNPDTVQSVHSQVTTTTTNGEKQ